MTIMPAAVCRPNTTKHVLTYTRDGYNVWGQWGKPPVLDYTIPECSCRIYSVSVWSISASSRFFSPGTSHKTHRNKHTPRNRSCVSHSQPPADCEVTNEHCHPAKHLLALLLQLCTEVLPFCFRVRVCRCARVCVCNVENTATFRWLFSQTPIPVHSFFFLAANMWVTVSCVKGDLFKRNSRVLHHRHGRCSYKHTFGKTEHRL